MLLTPSNQRRCALEDQKYFLNALVIQNIQAVNCSVFERIVIDIEPFTIRCEDDVLLILMNYYNQLNQAMLTTDLQSVYVSNSYFIWQQSKLSHQD